MLFSKLALTAVCWKLPLATLASEDMDNCAALPNMEQPLGASALLQHSGSSNHASMVGCNFQCYLDRYPDLQNLPGESKLAVAEKHWIRIGKKEGRDCTCGATASSKADSLIPDATEYVSMKAKPTHSTQGKCLKFLHIPKNAGATIEEIRKERKLEIESLSGVDESHRGYGWGESIVNDIHCTAGIFEDGWERKCVLQDRLGNSGECSIFHVPPTYDKNVAAAYEGCDTFCIARHPLSKAVSQHTFLNGECTVEDFSEKVKFEAQQLTANPFREDCHWVPQTMYTKHCQRILRFEHLTEDFDAMMRDYGYNITLGDHHNTHGATHCDLGDRPDLMPRETMEWLEKFYAADFEELGYKFTTRD